EQQMLLDTTRRWVADHYDIETRRHIVASPEGFSRAVWQQFADLGLLGLNVPEAYGGLDAGPISTFLVSMALGEALVVDPYLSSAVVATRALATMASPAQQKRWLPELTAGSLIAIVAHEEFDIRPARPTIQTRAVQVSGGWRLEGRKTAIYHASL